MNVDIIRAWKDRNYRESLSDEELAQLPQNPVGQIELTDEQLKEVSGAMEQTGSWRWCGGGGSWRWCGGGRSWRWCGGGRSWRWCGGGRSWRWCGHHW